MAGNDQLWGRPNDDTFLFNLGSGNDVINDFNQGNLAVASTATEHDLIDVQDYHFADWTSLYAAISDDTNGNAVIHLSASNSITLSASRLPALHFDYFII